MTNSRHYGLPRMRARADASGAMGERFVLITSYQRSQTLCTHRPACSTTRNSELDALVSTETIDAA